MRGKRGTGALGDGGGVQETQRGLKRDSGKGGERGRMGRGKMWEAAPNCTFGAKLRGGLEPAIGPVADPKYTLLPTEPPPPAILSSFSVLKMAASQHTALAGLNAYVVREMSLPRHRARSENERPAVQSASPMKKLLKA